MNQHHMWKRLAEERQLELTRRAEHARLVRYAHEILRNQRAGGWPGVRARLGEVLIRLGFRLHPAAGLTRLLESSLPSNAPSVSAEKCT